MEQHYKNVIQMTTEALNGVNRSRPTCKEMLNRRNEQGTKEAPSRKWALDYSAVQMDIEDMVELEAKYNVQNQFVLKFLQTKLLQQNKMK